MGGERSKSCNEKHLDCKCELNSESSSEQQSAYNLEQLTDLPSGVSELL